MPLRFGQQRPAGEQLSPDRAKALLLARRTGIVWKLGWRHRGRGRLGHSPCGRLEAANQKRPAPSAHLLRGWGQVADRLAAGIPGGQPLLIGGVGQVPPAGIDQRVPLGKLGCVLRQGSQDGPQPPGKHAAVMIGGCNPSRAAAPPDRDQGSVGHSADNLGEHRPARGVPVAGIEQPVDKILKTRRLERRQQGRHQPAVQTQQHPHAQFAALLGSHGARRRTIFPKPLASRRHPLGLLDSANQELDLPPFGHFRQSQQRLNLRFRKTVEQIANGGVGPRARRGRRGQFHNRRQARTPAESGPLLPAIKIAAQPLEDKAAGEVRQLRLLAPIVIGGGLRRVEPGGHGPLGPREILERLDPFAPGRGNRFQVPIDRFPAVVQQTPNHGRRVTSLAEPFAARIAKGVDRHAASTQFIDAEFGRLGIVERRGGKRRDQPVGARLEG